MEREIRVCLKFRPSHCPGLFDDLEQLGKFFRAAHLRNILLQHYNQTNGARPIVSPTEPRPTASVDDSSADGAMGSLDHHFETLSGSKQ